MLLLISSVFVCFGVAVLVAGVGNCSIVGFYVVVVSVDDIVVVAVVVVVGVGVVVEVDVGNGDVDVDDDDVVGLGISNVVGCLFYDWCCGYY